mmetsp:Transcript_76555/g.155385  ORF Transcript_76555/g.155385 Transcript_76555/m.155385 type:complete len:240 (+) Transcript_76555:198-917(+)
MRKRMHRLLRPLPRHRRTPSRATRRQPVGRGQQRATGWRPRPRGCRLLAMAVVASATAMAELPLMEVAACLMAVQEVWPVVAVALRLPRWLLSKWAPSEAAAAVAAAAAAMADAAEPVETTARTRAMTDTAGAKSTPSAMFRSTKLILSGRERRMLMKAWPRCTSLGPVASRYLLLSPRSLRLPICLDPSLSRACSKLVLRRRCQFRPTLGQLPWQAVTSSALQRQAVGRHWPSSCPAS